MVVAEMLVIQQPLGKCMTDLQASGLWQQWTNLKLISRENSTHALLACRLH